MNVLRRILYSAIVAAVLTGAAVGMFPGLELVRYVIPVVGAGLIVTLALAAVSFHSEDDLTLHDKNMLMNGFLVAILVPSFYTAGAFVHQSQTSWSGGEVHYHADFEVLVEDGGELQELDLADPGVFCKTATGQSSLMCKLNDRTGLKEYHEHNDDRIHLEGTFKTMEDASLAAFFDTFNGELSNSKLVFPTNDGVVEKTNSGNRTLKILVHRGVAGNRRWCAIGDVVPQDERCRNQYTGGYANSPSGYVVSPYSRGPNLDDIFIVYDSKTLEQALADVREDNEYSGFGLTKEGSGYGG